MTHDIVPFEAVSSAPEAELILPGDESVKISAAAHPFKTASTQYEVPAGLTVQEIVELAQPDPVLRRHGHVYVDDEYVPQEAWGRVRPKPGTRLTMRLVPSGGGGGKNPLRLILTVLVVVVAAWAAHALVTSSLATAGKVLGLTQGAWTGIFSTVGMLLVNAIAPPPKPSINEGTKEKPTYFLEGARNQLRPFSPIPRVLGTHRMVPPLGAEPYTQVWKESDWHILHLLFVWGYGPLKISDLRIGETPLEEFKGYQIYTHTGDSSPQQFAHYPHDVHQENLSVKLEKRANQDPNDVWHVRETDRGVDRISVDITFPQGLVRFADSGAKTNHTVRFDIQYRPANVANADWVDLRPAFAQAQKAASQAGFVLHHFMDGLSPSKTDFDSYVDELETLYAPQWQWSVYEGWPQTYGPVTTDLPIDKGVSLTLRKSVAVRRQYEWGVPRGKYEVRLRRVTNESTSDRVVEDAYWTALRTFTHIRPVLRDDIAYSILRIKATDQLNGIIDQFNGVVSSIIPIYKNGNWNTEEVSSNPAALFRHVLMDKANRRPLDESRIDNDGLGAWYDWCEAPWAHEGGNMFPYLTNIRYRYGRILEQGSSLRDVLNEIASAGRASPTNIDGKWGVVIDHHQNSPVQHFTPRNSWGFEARKAFRDLPHGFRVRFANRDKDYDQDEIEVYDYGINRKGELVDDKGKVIGTIENPTFETLDLPGITDEDLIHVHARYHIASARLRPETYTFYTDIEHIVCTRGDLIRVSHDVPLWGVTSGRVIDVTIINSEITAVTLDEICQMDAGKEYSLRVRDEIGNTAVYELQNLGQPSITLIFENAISDVSAIKAGDLALYGEIDQESVELLVKAIEPGNDLTAKITCVDAAPDLMGSQIHNPYNGAVNRLDRLLSFDPQITIPTSVNQISFGSQPMVPVIEGFISDETALIVGPNDTIITRVLVNIAPQAVVNAKLHVRVRDINSDDSGYTLGKFENVGTQLVLTGLEDGHHYSFGFRWIPNDARVPASNWTWTHHRVRGKTLPPQALSDVSLMNVGNIAIVKWQPAKELDVKYGGRVVVRHSPRLYDPDNPELGPDWRDSNYIASISADNDQVYIPLISGTYLLRVKDSTGRFSRDVSRITTEHIIFPSYTSLTTLTEHPTFPGEKTNVTVYNDKLGLAGDGYVDDIGVVDVNETFDDSVLIDYLGGLSLSGDYLFDEDYAVDLSVKKTVIISPYIDVFMNETLQDFDSRKNAISEWADFDGSDRATGAATLYFQSTDDDPDPAQNPLWSDWMEMTSAPQVSARGLNFKLVLTTSDPAYDLRIDELSIQIQEA